MAGKWSKTVSSILSEVQGFSRPAPIASFKDFLTATDAFDKKNKFPVSATRCKKLKLSEAEQLSNINGCYPLVGEDVLKLCCAFLAMKRTHGTSKEKDLYARISILDFFDRLLSKRPLVFINSNDSYRLKDSKIRGHGGFEMIGSDAESSPLLIRDFVTYDEIKLAALVNFAGPTAVINSGGRYNGGIPFDGTKPFEPHAIYVGLVGARFENHEVMESQEILIKRDITVASRGYGLMGDGDNLGDAKDNLVDAKVNSGDAKDITGNAINNQTDVKDNSIDVKEPTSCLELMAQFYDQSLGFPSYEDVLKNDNSVADKRSRGLIREIEAYSGTSFFNAEVYKRRIRCSVFPFLAEANERARASSKRAYVHVVGLGLGVWKIFKDQNDLFVEVFADILSTTKFGSISDVDFSYLHVDKCGEAGDGQIFPGTEIKVHFSRRDPFDKLKGEEAAAKLIVASWAYDGNSFIGNEYWDNALTASGDPAAACCSQIAELLNPCINPMVSGANLHVALADGRIVSLKNYVDDLVRD